MFLTIGDGPPRDAEDLGRSILEGLRAVTGPGGAEPSVRAEGEDPDRPDLLEVVLDGVRLDPERRPRPGKEREPGPVVRAFRFGGKGVRVGGAEIDLAIEASGAEFARSRDREGRAMLLPVAAREGRADLFVPRATLETLLGDGIREKAAGQGIEVTDVGVELEPDRGRVRARLAVTVKKVFTAKVRVSALVGPGRGPAVILSDVSCRGEGLAGSMVAKLARPQVEALDGRELSLAAFLPPGLAPREVTLAAEDGLRVRAVLGGAPDGG